MYKIAGGGRQTRIMVMRIAGGKERFNLQLAVSIPSARFSAMPLLIRLLLQAKKSPQRVQAVKTSKVRHFLFDLVAVPFLVF